LFQPLNRANGQLYTITLEKPLGLIFEEDPNDKRKRIRIAEIVENSQAAQLANKAKLDPTARASAPAGGYLDSPAVRSHSSTLSLAQRARSFVRSFVPVGDVLRGLTTTVVTWGEGALIAQTPKREIVVFGADGQKFTDASVAMKRSMRSDGPVTLVLERESSLG